MSFYKDNPKAQSVSLVPDMVYTGMPGAGTRLGALARTYNRLGGLIDTLADITGIDAKAVLAVWYVESAGRKHPPGRPILRFENHQFYKRWGKAHKVRFDRHFQFGGRKGIPGKSWKNHKFRKTAGASWKKFHGNQTKEYNVFAFASDLASLNHACLACSFGGPQVMGFNHDQLGYGDAASLYKAFALSERWHVCGFFDFCKTGKLIKFLKARRWRRFAKGYNGDGAADVYGAKIKRAFKTAGKLDALPQVPSGPGAAPAAIAASGTVPPGAPALAAAPAPDAFTSYINTLGLRHFKAYEFLVKGAKHANPDSPGYGLNTDPPRAKWPNIAATARVLDELRERLEVPIVMTSVYRSPAYNAAIGGATASLHMRFNAIDFVVRNHMSPDTWAAAVREMRSAGMFKGGIGTYAGFVHVDTRGINVDWPG